MKQKAAANHYGFAALSKATGCSTGCGMCKPYVLLMLETGETVFPLFSEATAVTIVARFLAGQPGNEAGGGKNTAPPGEK